jgi:membrane fusion protein, copper/silver efflux system
VIAKHANEGMKIDPGMQVFRIADLSRVWVLVTLYESQLPYVSEGQRAVMTLSYIPGQTFEGRVVFIYPYVETRTREVQVRLEFENPTGLLKPGMFATVELESTLKQEAVLAPRSAVISTGTRNVAFVSKGEGRFEPREVQLGVETGSGNVEILEGLAPGELVVTSGQFLLDSESRVREALAKMITGEQAATQPAEAVVSGASEVKSLPEGVASGLEDALRSYFVLGDSLASDTPTGLDDTARSLAAALDEAIGVPIPDDEHFWHKHTEAAVARGKALEMVGMSDLAKEREAFAELSVALDTLIRATGVPPGMGEEVESLHCPMFREGQGGSTWLQRAGPVRNPFFGSTMLGCFDQRESLAVTGQAPAAGGGDQ